MFPSSSALRPPCRAWRQAIRHAVDLAVAFTTLESFSFPRPHGPSVDPAAALHPHRRPLGPPPRTRRSGAVPPRPAICIASLRGGAPAPRRTRGPRADLERR